MSEVRHGHTHMQHPYLIFLSKARFRAIHYEQGDGECGKAGLQRTLRKRKCKDKSLFFFFFFFLFKKQKKGCEGKAGYGQDPRWPSKVHPCSMSQQARILAPQFLLLRSYRHLVDGRLPSVSSRSKSQNP